MRKRGREENWCFFSSFFFSTCADVKGRRRWEHVPRERAHTRGREREAEQGISGGTLIEKARAKERERENMKRLFFYWFVILFRTNGKSIYIDTYVPVDVCAVLLWWNERCNILISSILAISNNAQGEQMLTRRVKSSSWECVRAHGAKTTTTTERTHFTLAFEIGSFFNRLADALFFLICLFAFFVVHSGMWKKQTRQKTAMRQRKNKSIDRTMMRKRD